MKIAYLGPKGSFSHHVVQTAFPHEELEPFSNITDVIKAYEQGLVDYSVVPVENSIEGSVHETLDYLFHQARIQAVAEIVQPIHQQLMAVPGQVKIDKIYSHHRPWLKGRNLLMSIIQTLNWKLLPVQPTLRAMFPSIQISLLRPLPPKVRLENMVWN